MTTNRHLVLAEARQRAIDALLLGCSLKVAKDSDGECHVDFNIARSLVASGIAEWDHHPQGGVNFQRIIAKQTITLP